MGMYLRFWRIFISRTGLTNGRFTKLVEQKTNHITDNFFFCKNILALKFPVNQDKLVFYYLQDSLSAYYHCDLFGTYSAAKLKNEISCQNSMYTPECCSKWTETVLIKIPLRL